MIVESNRPESNGVVRSVSSAGEQPEERRCKQVMLLKNPADDLGMAIIGGKEHNLPIMISEIFPNSAVARAAKVSKMLIFKLDLSIRNSSQVIS